MFLHTFYLPALLRKGLTDEDMGIRRVMAHGKKAAACWVDIIGNTIWKQRHGVGRCAGRARSAMPIFRAFA